MPTPQQLASQRAQAQRAAAGYKQTPAAGARPPVKPPGVKPADSGWPKGPGGVPQIPGGTSAPPAPIGGGRGPTDVPGPGGIGNGPKPPGVYGDVPPPWMGGGGNPLMPGGPPISGAGGNPMPGGGGMGPIPTGGGQTWTPDSGQSIGDWMSSLPGGGGGVDPNLANQRQANEQARQLAIQQSPGPLNQLPGPSGWPKDPSGNPTVPPAQKNFDSGTDFIRSDPNFTGSGQGPQDLGPQFQGGFGGGDTMSGISGWNSNTGGGTPTAPTPTPGNTGTPTAPGAPTGRPATPTAPRAPMGRPGPNPSIQANMRRQQAAGRGGLGGLF